MAPFGKTIRIILLRVLEEKAAQRPKHHLLFRAAESSPEQAHLKIRFPLDTQHSTRVNVKHSHPCLVYHQVPDQKGQSDQNER
jgi:hypothetical protein